MIKKLISLILCVVLAVGGCIGLTSCAKNSSKDDIEITKQEVIDELVNIALEEADIRIEDYVDVTHFVNLGGSAESSIRNSVKRLTLSDEEVRIGAEQYEALTSSVSDIFTELTDEEYDAIKMLAEEDGEIAEMLQMVESDFEGYGYETDNSEITISTTRAALTSSAIVTIGSILLSQGVNSAAVVAIKGAFNTMIGTLKAFFLTNTVKAVIITAAILVIATVVIINWNKIKSVFNQIVNVFVDNAKKLASTVANVFNSILNTAKSSTISAGKDAAFKDIINEMGKFGLTKAIITSLIKEFTKLDINNDNDNKTVYLGGIEDLYYDIANKDGNGVAFHVADAKWDYYKNKYTEEGLWLVNKAFLQYVVHKRWEIVLVTNPYIHYNLVTHTKLTPRYYARELEFLANRGAAWHSEGQYWRVDKAW